MDIQRIDFLGLPLDVGLTTEGICDMLRQKGAARMVAYISPSSWAVAKRRLDYLAALRQMSVIRAGGEGVARACRWLTGKSCPRINFDMTSLADSFFRTAIAEQATIMLVGGEPGVGERMEEKLLAAYPQLKIVGVQHGYGEFAPKAETIVTQAPDAVIVAMGSPRQELFLVALRETGYKGMGITCGGFFDQYLDNVDYYPNWINRWNLRFAYRLFKEPRRLWRRYLIDYQIFIGCVLKALAEKWRSRFFGPRRENKASPPQALEGLYRQQKKQDYR